MMVIIFFQRVPHISLHQRTSVHARQSRTRSGSRLAGHHGIVVGEVLAELCRFAGDENSPPSLPPPSVPPSRKVL